MSEPKKILIVDDEIDMRLFLSTLTETSGYVPVLARNGVEGLETAGTALPDLIMLDIMMPKEGGVYMYGRLKTTDTLKDIPVIILLAISRKTFYHYLKMLSIRVGGPIAEPDAYLEKPPEAEDILDIIKQLIG